MYYEVAVTQFTKMLRNTLAIMEKAAGYADMKKFDTEVLLNSRLAPDQFTFTRQIQIMCDTAKMCVARLADKQAPTHPDDEKTLAALRTRIETTIAYLSTFTPTDFARSATLRVSMPRWEGKTLSGEEFFMQHAVPNFYFHTTTAYAILRHNGVDIGKRDYLGTMPFKT